MHSVARVVTSSEPTERSTVNNNLNRGHWSAYLQDPL